MTDRLFGDAADRLSLPGVDGVYSWARLGISHRQEFYAVRAPGAADSDLRLPFSARPFAALVDLAGSATDAALMKFASILIRHGCVQAICRGEEAHRLHRIFEDLAETGELDGNGAAFTSMCAEDEPRGDVLSYFSLPCGLARTKLILVIGENRDFREALDDYSGFFGLAGEPEEASAALPLEETAIQRA